MLKIVNLKEDQPDVTIALAMVEIAIDNALAEGVSVIKVLHGYGSHGKGGTILIALREMLRRMQRQHKIQKFYGGDKWNMFDADTLAVLQKDKDIVQEEDLNRANPGITIIIL